jgi:hypothetical protein
MITEVFDLPEPGKDAKDTGKKLREGLVYADSARDYYVGELLYSTPRII